MIIRGGENIQPTEVESFIGTIEEVQDCYVIGVPSRRLGQEAAAYIKLKDGASLTEETLLKHCKSGLAQFKHPRYIKFIKEFPEFSTGKIKKVELLQWAFRDFTSLQLEIEE